MGSFIKSSENSDKELVIRLQEDDVKAFDTLYRKYQLSLYRNIFKLVRDEDHTQDILQDVFVKLWEKRITIDPEQSVANWLFVISYNKSLTYLKKALRDPLVFRELNDEIPLDSEQGIHSRESQLQLLEKAFSQLSPQKRKVFELCKLHGKTYEETARELNISKHTVKEYLSEAMLNIKEYVNNHPQEFSTLGFVVLFSSFFD